MDLKYLLLLFCLAICFDRFSSEGQNSTNANGTATTTAATNISCPAGSMNPPACNECQVNYQRHGNECIALMSQNGSTSRSTGRRLFLLFIGGLFTVVLVIGMIFAYGHLVEPQRHRRRSNPTNPNEPSSDSVNLGQRLRRAFQGIPWNPLNKRGRFNFFSISNNNATSSHLRQSEHSRTHLSENPDEALLFDDPYADGGLHGSSANPYKSLTLAVT